MCSGVRELLLVGKLSAEVDLEVILCGNEMKESEMKFLKPSFESSHRTTDWVGLEGTSKSTLLQSLSWPARTGSGCPGPIHPSSSVSKGVLSLPSNVCALQEQRQKLIAWICWESASSPLPLSAGLEGMASS